MKADLPVSVYPRTVHSARHDSLFLSVSVSVAHFVSSSLFPKNPRSTPVQQGLHSHNCMDLELIQLSSVHTVLFREHKNLLLALV